MTDSIFSLILFGLVVISGIITFLDVVWLSKKKKESSSNSEVEPLDKANSKKNKPSSGVIETIRSVFPVLLFVFILRSFLYAPFKIPSGSMIPSLKIGDHILVSKFAYGLKIPYFGTKFWSVGEPKRGDIVVFRGTDEFAHQNKNKKEDLIKRLVGLPGDHIRYDYKKLYINGKVISKKFIRSEDGEYDVTMGGAYPFDVYSQKLGKQKFEIQNYPDVTTSTGEWTIPEGMYFMMGDNRDLSDDSRYWGFVPEKNIIGKAVLVWMHWTSWSSLPSFKNDRMLHSSE